MPVFMSCDRKCRSEDDGDATLSQSSGLRADEGRAGDISTGVVEEILDAPPDLPALFDVGDGRINFLMKSLLEA
ncbi:MAG TPA: hypothetical protein VEC06_00115 [Paucimonas sp.]|nr:hypothetical protein [Paucimonas sp.]